MSAIEEIDVNGLIHHKASVNGHEYNYLNFEPETCLIRATVFLIHGWPDLSVAWRLQIPALLKLSFRIVCPDLLGFGRSDAPTDLAPYTHRRVCGDIKGLANHLGLQKIILGGHDWGGAVVYRCALYHPELVTHVFSICTPFSPPVRTWVPLEDLATRHPSFNYQLQLAGQAVEDAVKTPIQIRQFLNGMYGGRGPNRESLFDPTQGVLLENLPKVGKTRLMTEKMMNYYVQEYSRHGIGPTLNWYRTTRVRYEEELDIPQAVRINQPVLFIQATNDDVLRPYLSRGMEEYIPNLTRQSVGAGHWALWQRPADVNGHLVDWFERVVIPDLERKRASKI